MGSLSCEHGTGIANAGCDIGTFQEVSAYQAISFSLVPVFMARADGRSG